MPLKPKLKMLAEANSELAKEAARSLQFERFTADWPELVNDPEVELVDLSLIHI